MRTKVWWAGLDKDVEKICKACYPCQVIGALNPPEPAKKTQLPSGPWQHLAADLMTTRLPSGNDTFVFVDYYSRYIELQVMTSTTADKIIASLEKIFLTHGLPISISTDNGSQFASEEFRKFIGITQRRTTPLWPQDSGKVERQKRSPLKRIGIAPPEKKGLKKNLELI